jgi:hypothetical protein
MTSVLRDKISAYTRSAVWDDICNNTWPDYGTDLKVYSFVRNSLFLPQSFSILNGCVTQLQTYDFTIPRI